MVGFTPTVDVGKLVLGELHTAEFFDSDTSVLDVADALVNTGFFDFVASDVDAFCSYTSDADYDMRCAFYSYSETVYSPSA